MYGSASEVVRDVVAGSGRLGAARVGVGDGICGFAGLGGHGRRSRRGCRVGERAGVAGDRAGSGVGTGGPGRPGTAAKVPAVRRRPWMAPPLDRMVERPELGERLIAALLAP